MLGGRFIFLGAALALVSFGFGHLALGGSPPIGGGGSCTGMTNDEGFQGQQSSMNNGLYTCSGGIFVPEALIIGSKSQDGTSLTCVAGTAGAIRYNSGSGIVEVCNGTAWLSLFVSACDANPAPPYFSEQTDLATSTLATSNIALVTSMDVGCNATIGVSGTGGSPEYRVCNDSSCTSVLQTWTNGNNSFALQGKYVQLRATSSATQAAQFIITLDIGPTSSNWPISTGLTGCTPIGTVCSDGTIYAGISGSGTPMYTTRCDAGQSWNGSACTGTRTTYCWNNCNNAGFVVTGATSNSYGQGNSATINATDSDTTIPGVQPHLAVQYCENLSADGHSDWFLPAINEYTTLYNNNVAIGNFDVSGQYYWSSTESSYNGTVDGTKIEFSGGTTQNGFYGGSTKDVVAYVRCVRS